MNLLLFVLVFFLTCNEQNSSSLILMSTISDSTEQKDSNEEISDNLKYKDESMALKIPSFNEFLSKFHLKIVKPHPWMDYKMMISKPDSTMDYKMLIKGPRRSGVLDIKRK